MMKNALLKDYKCLLVLEIIYLKQNSKICKNIWKCALKCLLYNSETKHSTRKGYQVTNNIFTIFYLDCHKNLFNFSYIHYRDTK